MKTRNGKFMIFLLTLFCWSSITILQAQEDSTAYVTISGVVKDSYSKKCLGYVNVSLKGTNIGTVTNADGIFSLKLKATNSMPTVEVSHLGYRNYKVLPSSGEYTDMKIWLVPTTNLLNEIVIYPNNPRFIVEKAIEKIPQNYTCAPNMLTGFYRETAQKGKRYINISEGVVDVYKSSYENSGEHDKVRILKGRKLLSQKTGDTLGVKLIGGPNLFVNLDIVKNRDGLLSMENLNYYNFVMEESVSIDDRQQYVIGFYPKDNLLYALYIGKFYIDKERLSFTRAEFSMDMTDPDKVTQFILYKKPAGLRFKPQELTYLVTYKYEDGVSYLSYIKNTIHFKCDWKRKLFATNYNVVSEMVVTDHTDKNVTPIPYRMAFGDKDIFYDTVTNFQNGDFWENYNIIEPTESLEHVVGRLIKKSYL